MSQYVELWITAWRVSRAPEDRSRKAVSASRCPLVEGIARGSDVVPVELSPSHEVRQALDPDGLSTED